jgi:hypothetical protein
LDFLIEKRRTEIKREGPVRKTCSHRPDEAALRRGVSGRP